MSTLFSIWGSKQPSISVLEKGSLAQGFNCLSRDSMHAKTAAQSASKYWMENELNRDISVGFLPFPVKCQTKLWELSCHWGILLAGVSEWKSILRSRKAKPVSQVFTQISWSLGKFLDRATVRLPFFALQNNQKSVALLFGNRIQFALNFHLKSTKESRHETIWSIFFFCTVSSRGVPDLVDLYRMVVANMEFLDNSFSSKRLESTLVPRVLIHVVIFEEYDLTFWEKKKRCFASKEGFTNSLYFFLGVLRNEGLDFSARLLCSASQWLDVQGCTNLGHLVASPWAEGYWRSGTSERGQGRLHGRSCSSASGRNL